MESLSSIWSQFKYLKTAIVPSLLWAFSMLSVQSPSTIPPRSLFSDNLWSWLPSFGCGSSLSISFLNYGARNRTQYSIWSLIKADSNGIIISLALDAALRLMQLSNMLAFPLLVFSCSVTLLNHVNTCTSFSHGLWQSQPSYICASDSFPA